MIVASHDSVVEQNTRAELYVQNTNTSTVSGFVCEGSVWTDVLVRLCNFQRTEGCRLSY